MWARRFDGCKGLTPSFQDARSVRAKATGPDRSGPSTLTVRELAPDIDYVAQSIGFWRDVEQRIQQLRAEDEGWQKEIAAGENQ